MRSFAREYGAFDAQAHYRVVVSEEGGKITCTDFADLQQARQYAADCAWETENGPVTATIFDRQFEKVL